MTSRQRVARYLVATGIVSLVLFGLSYLVTSIKVPLYIQTITMNLSAWSPTIAVLILFKHLFPGQKLRTYLQRVFSTRINPLIIVLLLIIQGSIIAYAIAVHFLISGKGINSLHFVTLPTVLSTFVLQLLSGATGEELGWRGYLLNELRTRHSLLGSALLVGIVWGFWHLPIWFTRGYAGGDLLLYIVFFLVQIISLSIIMAVLYSREENLLIPIWIHFLVNFLVGLVNIEQLNLIGWMSFGYAAFAVILILVERKRMLINSSSVTMMADKNPNKS
jgi:membrane protease YdiL (CAAX protease family)